VLEIEPPVTMDRSGSNVLKEKLMSLVSPKTSEIEPCYYY